MIPWMKECKRPLVRRIPGLYLFSSLADVGGMGVCVSLEAVLAESWLYRSVCMGLSSNVWFRTAFRRSIDQTPLRLHPTRTGFVSHVFCASRFVAHSQPHLYAQCLWANVHASDMIKASRLSLPCLFCWIRDLDRFTSVGSLEDMLTKHATRGDRFHRDADQGLNCVCPALLSRFALPHRFGCFPSGFLGWRAFAPGHFNNSIWVLGKGSRTEGNGILTRQSNVGLMAKFE